MLRCIYRPACLIAIILALLCLASVANAGTYYISTSGSDSNSGTATGSPWLHIPGENGCTANCAAHTPVAGDKFIFRGGDHWHKNSGTPIFGHTSFTWSGSAANCDVLNGLTSSCIYIGVDKTWFAGGSWTRPVIDYDNSLSTSTVSSCAYPGNGTSANFTFNIIGSYVTLDNFEIIGWCQGNFAAAHSNFIELLGNYDTVENMYQHGWTHVASCTVASSYCEDDSLVYGNPSFNVVKNSLLLNNTLNGSDSSPGQGSLCKYQCAYVVGNTVRYVSQAIVGTNTAVFAGNWIDHIQNPWDGQSHGNVDEMAQIPMGTDIYIYNNLLSNSALEVGFWVGARDGNSLYFYNNVVYGVTQSTGNCVMISNAGSDTASWNGHFYHNTLASPCGVRYTANNAEFICARGTAKWTNNIAVGYGSFPQTVDSACAGTMPITYTTNRVMSASEANTYGFTSATNYSPSSADSNTVQKGTNLAPTCSETSPLCKDASGTQWFGSSYVNRPESGNPDLGAYQFGTSSASGPAPPTNLTATVQ